MIPRQTIWIAPRTDGKPGKGTRLDPFDGSGEKFDQLMRTKLGSYTRVHLTPWGTNDKAVFRTTGSKSYNASLGFYIPSFVEIIGAGMDRVTVQKIAHPDTGGNAHGIFEMDASEVGDVRIEGMTINEGGQDLAGKSTSTFAARLLGNNCVLRSLHAINGYGHRSSNAEAFELTIGPNCKEGKWQENTGGLMDKLVVSHFCGDYGFAITPVPGPDGTGFVRTIVRDCLVTDYRGTAPYGMPSHVRFQRCKAVGCIGGWYGDTGVEQTDFEMEDCKILSPTGGYGVHFNPVNGKIVRKVLIERCVIEVSNLGIAASGGGSPGHQFDFTIRRNKFIRAGTSSEPSLPGIVFAYMDGAKVYDNLSDSRLHFITDDPNHPSKNIKRWHNGSLPAPAGLEDNE